MAESRFAPPLTGQILLDRPGGLREIQVAVYAIKNTQEIIDLGWGPERIAATVNDRKGHPHKWRTKGYPITTKQVRVSCDGVCGDTGCDGWTETRCTQCGEPIAPPTTYRNRSVPGMRSGEVRFQAPIAEDDLLNPTEGGRYDLIVEDHRFTLITTSTELNSRSPYITVTAAIVG